MEPVADRDQKGRFQLGHKLGGRPPGPDFKKMLEEQCTEHGIDLEAAFFQIVQAQVIRAQAGDTDAARFLFDRVYGKESKQSGPHRQTLEELINETMEVSRQRLEMGELKRELGRPVLNVVSGVVDSNHPKNDEERLQRINAVLRRVKDRLPPGDTTSPAALAVAETERLLTTNGGADATASDPSPSRG